MKLSTNEEEKSYENAKICNVSKETFEDKYAKDKKYHKVRVCCHYTGECRDVPHTKYNLKYSMPKEILIVFHNGSNYDYHFMVKELAEKQIQIYLKDNILN